MFRDGTPGENVRKAYTLPTKSPKYTIQHVSKLLSVPIELLVVFARFFALILASELTSFKPKCLIAASKLFPEKNIFGVTSLFD